jgi:hypothetical protein
VSLSIKITGARETEASFKRIAAGVSRDVVEPELTLWSIDIHKGFVKREHVWKGTMKSRTHMVNVGPLKKENRVDVKYAEKENQRKGDKMRGKGTGHGTPHQFVEPTLTEENPKHFDSMVNKVTRYINDTR